MRRDFRHAIAGYANDAMTYVLQLAPHPPVIDESLIRSLHFMMLKYDLGKHPGQWRPGAIWVEDPNGRVVYTAPDRDEIEPLMAELLSNVNIGGTSARVRAAMAHLNLGHDPSLQRGQRTHGQVLARSLVLTSIDVDPFTGVFEHRRVPGPQHFGLLRRPSQRSVRASWHPERSARP